MFKALTWTGAAMNDAVLHVAGCFVRSNRRAYNHSHQIYRPVAPDFLAGGSAEHS